jgi:hypothetical protein
MKRYRTEKHWSKWPPRIGVAAMIISAYQVAYEGHILSGHFLAIGMLLSFKPLFDIGWSIGRFETPMIYIGESDWTDKILRWMKLDVIERKYFPVLTFLYFTSIVGGLLLIIYSFVK